MREYFEVFLLGFWVSYLATLPPGMISLNVMETTIRKGLKQSVVLAVAACLVEFIQAFVSVKFSGWFSENPVVDSIFKIFVIPVFFLLGSWYIWKELRHRKTPPKETPDIPKVYRKRDSFGKGLLVSLLNPVAIPFWVFYALYFNKSGLLPLENSFIFTFVSATTIGTFACLMTYALFSALLSSRMDVIKRYVNLGIGGLFIVLGIIQIVRVVM